MTDEQTERWDEIFNVQYDLCREVDDLVTRHVGDRPAFWRSMVCAYLIEHLAERQRFDVELPPRRDAGGSGSQIATGLLADEERSVPPASSDFRCKNCGRTMAEHTSLMNCWPKPDPAPIRQAETEQSDESTPQ